MLAHEKKRPTAAVLMADFPETLSQLFVSICCWRRLSGSLFLQSRVSFSPLCHKVPRVSEEVNTHVSTERRPGKSFWRTQVDPPEELRFTFLLLLFKRLIENKKSSEIKNQQLIRTDNSSSLRFLVLMMRFLFPA